MAETDDTEPQHPESAESATASDDRATIREGRDFEREYRLSAAEAGRFLEDVGKQLQRADDLTLSTDEWVLPFATGDPVELDIDFEGVGEPALEVEVEIPGTSDDDAPAVE